MYTFLTAAGIGDTHNSMMKEVAKHLDPNLFVHKRLDWNNQYGPVPLLGGRSFQQNLRDGIEHGARVIDADPNPIFLGGFSGGAALMRMLASEVHRGLHHTKPIQGLANVADPYRPRGVGAPFNFGFGIAGEIEISDLWQREAADPADVICCCPANSPLRTLADQTSAFSLVDPTAWLQNIGWRLTTRQWQAVAMDFGNIRSIIDQYALASKGLDGYRRGGDHINYHTRIKPGFAVTYCKWLALELNRRATDLNRVRG